jgi:hypothetical protein
MCAKPASPLGEKHIFENQSVKLGLYQKNASALPRTLKYVRRASKDAGGHVGGNPESVPREVEREHADSVRGAVALEGLGDESPEERVERLADDVESVLPAVALRPVFDRI